MDEDRLQVHLRDRLGVPDLTVTHLRRNVGGMSRETWFATVTGTGLDETLTLRADHPEGAVVPVSLEREFQTFQALHGTAVPVAEALWYSDDPAILGRAPFYVRRMVPGSASAGKLFAPGGEARRERIGVQFAELLAAVHTLDWRAAGLDAFMEVPRDAREVALLELDRWERNYRARPVEPMPAMEALLAWLRRNVPADVPRVSLVWGDVGVGNFIYEGDRIVALTDWEQAHLGDPMKDWASALWRGVDALLPRDELFAAYEKASGIRIDEERVRYYTAFIDAEYVCTSYPVLRDFSTGNTRDVTFARLGLGVPYYCLDHGLRTIGY